MWYYYLNYRIYNYYERKMERMPYIYSFMGTVLLLTFNVFSIVAIISFMYPNDIINKYSTLGLSLFIAFFNFLILYRGKYYKEVFSDFDKYEDRYKNWKNSVPIYIISSIVLLLVVLAIADYRYDGRF